MKVCSPLKGLRGLVIPETLCLLILSLITILKLSLITPIQQWQGWTSKGPVHHLPAGMRQTTLPLRGLKL